MGPPSLLAFPEPTIAQEEFSSVPPMRMIKRQDSPLSVLQIWLRAGPLQELSHERGASALIDELIFGSQEDQQSARFQLTGLGAKIKTRTMLDRHLIEVEVMSEDLPKALALLGESLKRKEWTGASISTAKERRLKHPFTEGQWLRRRSALRLLSNLRERQGGLPVWISGEDFPDWASKLSTEEVRAYIQRVVHSTHCSLVIVGSFSKDEINRVLNSSWRDHETLRSVTQREAQSEVLSPSELDELDATQSPKQTASSSLIEFEETASQNTLISLLFPWPKFSPKEASYLDLISLNLLGQPDGLLYRIARSSGVDLYFAGLTPIITDDLNGVLITLQVKATQANEAWSTLISSLKQLTYQPLSQRALEQVKSQLERETLLINETLSGQAQRLGFFSSYWPETQALKAYGGGAYQVTSPQLFEFARTLFAQPNPLGVVISPPPETMTSTVWQERLNENLSTLSSVHQSKTKVGFNYYGSNIRVLFSQMRSGSVSSIYITIPLQLPNRSLVRYLALGHWQASLFKEMLRHEFKFNAHLNDDTLTLSSTFPSEAIGEAVSILMKKLRQAPLRSEVQWSSEHLERARRAALAELSISDQRPVDQMTLFDRRIRFSTLNQQLPLNPMRQQALRDASSSELMRWFRENIQSQPIYVVVSGDLSESQLNRAFSSVTPPTLTPPVSPLHQIQTPSSSPSDRCRETHITTDHDLGSVLLTASLPKNLAPSWVMMRLLETALSRWGMKYTSSHDAQSFKVIRLSPAHEQSIALLLTAPSTELKSVFDATITQIKALQTQPLRPEELTSLLRLAELEELRFSTASIGKVEWLTHSWFAGWQTAGMKDFSNWKQELKEIKSGALKEAAEKIFDPSHLRLVVLSSPELHKTITLNCLQVTP